MIIRVFRVSINPELREEFESKFSTVSIQAVQNATGFISVSIGKPTKWAPDEYVMVSKWQNESSLKKFAGENWNQAHIPRGMEQFISECWLHHYNEYEHA